ncbi:MAG TPA: FAD binding domain-containing protein, partial [Candidatus Sabulitectum sp.]|nr:FAD binding domain-containing protein [Candidatus Sabulitectum sp.]
PHIDGFLARVASTQIRSLATIGGNIVNASPIGDMAVLFLALGATVHTGRRSLPLKEFYLGYKKTDLDEGEIIESISFPLPREGARLSALKVCKREYLDIASVNSAALLVLQGSSVRSASLSAGGVYPYPLFLEAASSFLQGRELTESTILEAADIAAGEISPISDIRGSAEYKTELLRSQIMAHLGHGGV